MKIAITVSPRRVLQSLGIIIILLTAASTFGRFVGSERLFVLNAEANVPTWYASATLALCAMLLALIWAVKQQSRAPFTRHWLVLALVFLYLSLDESAKIHEIGNDLESILNTAGVIPKAWIIPAAVLLGVFGLAYFRFILSLPANTRRLFVVAGFLFVLGAMGLETIGGFIANRLAIHSAEYVAVATVEEFLEMVGVALFIYALLAYMGDQWQSMEIQVHIEGKANTEVLQEIPTE